MKYLILITLLCASIFGLTACTPDKCMDCKVGTRDLSYCEPDDETLRTQEELVKSQGGSCQRR